MPIYEYQCQACGNRLEELQKFDEAPLTQCPHCGKAKLQRLVSHTSFQLKGGGWYATDFKDKPKTPSTPETKTETPKAEETTKPKKDTDSGTTK